MPAVAFACGIELMNVRWLLALANLYQVSKSDPETSGRVVFLQGDITRAMSFDPFTHVYAFDIGYVLSY